MSEWLPALDGVVDRLEAGIAVADVGCGHGHSTILMAQAFPRSRFFGFDTHPASIRAARDNAVRAASYGLICYFDCLHDLGDPIGAARYAERVLARDGTVMVVEPFANDRVEDNVSPVARLYYAASTVLCCAHAISEGASLVLGAQAGEARLADVFRKAGLTHVRRAAESPFNLVLEVRR